MDSFLCGAGAGPALTGRERPHVAPSDGPEGPSPS